MTEHDKDRWLDHRRVFVSKTGKRYRYCSAFRAACAAAKVTDFTFRGLRHSAATYLAREGAIEQQLKAIGEWKLGIVSRYVHLAAEDAKAVVEQDLERRIYASHFFEQQLRLFGGLTLGWPDRRVGLGGNRRPVMSDSADRAVASETSCE